MLTTAFILQFSLLMLDLVSGQYSEPRLCDGVCYCSSADNVVSCDPPDHIQGVPTNLQPGIIKLFIQGGVFPEPGHLSSKNLSGLSHLVSLRIVNSQLRSIGSRAFLRMTNLRDLDLSMNRLQRIEPLTFYMLNLETLYLQEQQNQPDHSHSKSEPLMLANEALSGLSVRRIDLRRNHISNISFAQFSKVNNLEKLILSSNSIRQVEAKFADYFDKTDRLIDLTDNPLKCTCQIAWLVNREKEWALRTKTLNTTCLIDPQIGESGSKVELRKLLTSHLCMASRIQTIGVDVTPTGKAATLSCTAVAYSRLDSGGGLDGFNYGDAQQLSNQPIVRIRPPSVAWKYTEAGQLRQVTGMPSDLPQPFETPYRSNEYPKPTTTVQLNVSLSSANRKFTCITWDEKEDDHEILVTIRGPAMIPNVMTAINKNSNADVSYAKTLDRSDDNFNDADIIKVSGNLGYAPSNFFFQKQYTLLEMIGAVVGTFLVTIIVLLVGSRCLILLKNREISNCRSKEVGGCLSSYDPTGSKQSDALTSGLNTGGRARRNTSNGHVPTSDYDGIATFPIYGPYLATQASGVAYPSHLAPVTGGQLLPVSSNTPLLQSSILVSGIPGGAQTLTYWPAPPGSAYSGAGSHEYDIPRAMESSQFTSEAATTLPREATVVTSILSQKHQPPPAISVPNDVAFPVFLETSAAPMMNSIATSKNNILS